MESGRGRVWGLVVVKAWPIGQVGLLSTAKSLCRLLKSLEVPQPEAVRPACKLYDELRRTLISEDFGGPMLLSSASRERL